LGEEEDDRWGPPVDEGRGERGGRSVGWAAVGRKGVVERPAPLGRASANLEGEKGS